MSVLVERKNGLTADELLDAALAEAKLYGPVVSGDNGTLTLTLATESNDPKFLPAVVSTLERVGMAPTDAVGLRFE